MTSGREPSLAAGTSRVLGDRAQATPAAEEPPSGPEPRRKRVIAGLALGLLLAHAALVISTARYLGCTSDESHYFNEGRIIVRHGWAHELTWLQGPLPLVANQLFVRSFPPGGYVRGSDPGLLLRGRLGTLPFALLAAALVFLMARAAFGELGGLLALALHALNPLLIGYAATCLVDVHLAAFLLLAFFVLWRLLETGRALFLPLLGGALGLALGTKYLALLYALPLGLTAVGGAWWHARRRSARPSAWTGLGPAALAAVALAASAWLVLHACYGFRGGFSSPDPELYSAALVSRLVESPVTAPLLRLLPAPFLRGVDFQLATSERDWDVFLDGVFAPGHVDYYLWTFLCKTPELVLLGAALFLLRLPRLVRSSARARVLVLAVVPTLLLVVAYLSAGTSMQLGVRYILPLYPPLFVLLGALAVGRIARASTPALLGAGVLLLVLQAWDLARAWPDLLAFYNHVSGGQARAFHRFRDTNNEYGQRDRGPGELVGVFAGRFEALGPRSGARFGVLAASNGDLRARDPDAPQRSRFEWLTRGTLLAHAGAAWWLFEVTPEGLERAVAESGDPDLRQDLALAYLGAERLDEARVHLAELDRARAAPLEKLADLVQRPAEGEEALLARLRAWKQAGRPDRAAELLDEHPELVETREGMQAQLLLFEERKDLAGSIELLGRPGAADPSALQLVRELKRALRPHEILAVYDRIVSAGEGTAWAETEVFQEIRADRESLQRLSALLE